MVDIEAIRRKVNTLKVDVCDLLIDLHTIRDFASADEKESINKDLSELRDNCMTLVKSLGITTATNDTLSEIDNVANKFLNRAPIKAYDEDKGLPESTDKETARLERLNKIKADILNSGLLEIYGDIASVPLKQVNMYQEVLSELDKWQSTMEVLVYYDDYSCKSFIINKDNIITPRGKHNGDVLADYISGALCEICYGVDIQQVECYVQTNIVYTKYFTDSFPEMSKINLLWFICHAAQQYAEVFENDSSIASATLSSDDMVQLTVYGETTKSSYNNIKKDVKQYVLWRIKDDWHKLTAGMLEMYDEVLSRLCSWQSILQITLFLGNGATKTFFIHDNGDIYAFNMQSSPSDYLNSLILSMQNGDLSPWSMLLSYKASSEVLCSIKFQENSPWYYKYSVIEFTYYALQYYHYSIKQQGL
jgi:hypothetical protein